jgi:hypothetical protein
MHKFGVLTYLTDAKQSTLYINFYAIRMDGVSAKRVVWTDICSYFTVSYTMQKALLIIINYAKIYHLGDNCQLMAQR